MRSLLMVPLLAGGTCIGTLNIGSYAAEQLDEGGAEFLQEAANQVALAVANARAYERIAALEARLWAENLYLQEEISGESNHAEIVGNSPALRRSRCRRSGSARRTFRSSSAALAEAPPGGKSDAGRPRRAERWRAGRVESEEPLDRVRAAIDGLPPLGRAVVTMSDVSGCDARVTCAALGLSDSEHRRQLHVARSRVRGALDHCRRGGDRDRL